MDIPRKHGSVLSYAIKMKVLQDFDEDRQRTKVELAKLNGISSTSVARILRSRQELEAMSSEEHDKRIVGQNRPDTNPPKEAKSIRVSAENEKENLMTTSTEEEEPKKSDNKRRKSVKQKEISAKKRTKKENRTESKDELQQQEDEEQQLTEQQKEEENDFVLAPGTGGENPEAEARFEEALKTLEDYVIMILHSDEIVQDYEGPAECRLFSALYELYDDLMESEKEIWRRSIC